MCTWQRSYKYTPTHATRTRVLRDGARTQIRVRHTMAPTIEPLHLYHCTTSCSTCRFLLNSTGGNAGNFYYFLGLTGELTILVNDKLGVFNTWFSGEPVGTCTCTLRWTRERSSVYFEGKIQTATRINNSNLINIILYIINNYGPASNYWCLASPFDTCSLSDR